MANEESGGARPQSPRRVSGPGAIEIEGQGHDYDFPTIDFLFKNTGSTSALLWKFGIELLDFEIDPTPDLVFTYKVPGATVRSFEPGGVPPTGSLVISATNVGWGPARDVEVLLRESVLNRLFPSAERTFRGEIEAASTREILRLQPRQLDPGEVTRYRERSSARNVRPHSLAVPSAPIGTLMLAWQASDTKGGRHANDREASPVESFHYSELHLTPTGFVCAAGYFPAAEMPSTSTYCTILDPDRGVHTRTYPIARKIGPGDVERFHILVGATKSSLLRVRFKFWIDSDDIVESAVFAIHVYNPWDSGLTDIYIDGEELQRREAEIDRRLAELDRDSQDPVVQHQHLELLMERTRRSLQRPKGGAHDSPFLPAGARQPRSRRR